MFAAQKQNLLNYLQINFNRLLFPQTLLYSLERSGLYTLASFFNSYNSSIKKCRKLEDKLNQLESWGYLYNSYRIWNFSVLNNLKKIDIYKTEIVNYIKNSDFIKTTIFNQSNIQLSNILTFIGIQKINGEYILPSRKIKLTVDEIKTFLPRCIAPVDFTNPLKLETPHQLDPSDIFVQSN
jgi:hypothetical protein